MGAGICLQRFQARRIWLCFVSSSSVDFFQIKICRKRTDIVTLTLIPSPPPLPSPKTTSNLAKVLHVFEMYQPANSYTTYYTFKLQKNRWFLLIKGLSMYEKWIHLKVIWHKTEPIFNIIPCWTNFFIQTGSFFVYWETFNKKRIDAFLASSKYSRLCEKFAVHWILGFLTTPARTTDNTCCDTEMGRQSFTPKKIAIGWCAFGDIQELPG